MHNVQCVPKFVSVVVVLSFWEILRIVFGQKTVHIETRLKCESKLEIVESWIFRPITILKISKND